MKDCEFTAEPQWAAVTGTGLSVALTGEDGESDGVATPNVQQVSVKDNHVCHWAV